MARKNEKCQAIASSTGDRCRKKPMKWSRFCWCHSLRQPPLYITVILAVGGIVVTLILSEISASRTRAQMALTKEIVNSSNIDVCLKLSVNEKTQRELDATSYTSYTCELHTKSGHVLVFRSVKFATRLIITENQFEWQFSTVLSPQENIYRENPEEFSEAAKIVVPMAPFVRRARRDLSPDVVCTLKSVKVDFYVNSRLLKSPEKLFANNSVVEEFNELSVALNKETDR